MNSPQCPSRLVSMLSACGASPQLDCGHRTPAFSINLGFCRYESRRCVTSLEDSDDPTLLQRGARALSAALSRERPLVTQISHPDNVLRISSRCMPCLQALCYAPAAILPRFATCRKWSSHPLFQTLIHNQRSGICCHAV